MKVLIVLTVLFGAALAGDFKDYTSDTFQKECLTAHNKHRADHGTKPLVVDQKLVAFAIQRARTLATTEQFKHDAKGYGENLAWNWSSRGPAPVACSIPTDNWYNEIKDYNFADPATTPISRVGHFTQVVWAGSTKVGCAQAASLGPKGGVYTVCNYDPPGNYLGQFPANVKNKLNK